MVGISANEIHVVLVFVDVTVLVTHACSHSLVPTVSLILKSYIAETIITILQQRTGDHDLEDSWRNY